MDFLKFEKRRGGGRIAVNKKRIAYVSIIRESITFHFDKEWNLTIRKDEVESEDYERNKLEIGFVGEDTREVEGEREEEA